MTDRQWKSEGQEWRPLELPDDPPAEIQEIGTMVDQLLDKCKEKGVVIRLSGMKVMQPNLRYEYKPSDNRSDNVLDSYCDEKENSTE